MPDALPSSRTAAPLALAALLLAAVECLHPHPRDLLRLPVDTWLAVHYAQLPLFPLAALAVAALVRKADGALAWLCRAALFTFAVCYVAFDTVAGVVVGLLVQAAQHAPDPGAWRAPIMLLWMHPVLGGSGVHRAPLLAEIGSDALALGTLCAALLLRRAGAAWAPASLLALSGFGIVAFDTHAWPGGPLTFGGIGVAALWLLRDARRARGTAAAGTDDVDVRHGRGRGHDFADVMPPTLAGFTLERHRDDAAMAHREREAQQAPTDPP